MNYLDGMGDQPEGDRYAPAQLGTVGREPPFTEKIQNCGAEITYLPFF